MRSERRNPIPVSGAWAKPSRVAPPRPSNRALLAVMPIEHKPVLATELVELLAPQPGQLAVDCTFGAGGHARRVASMLGLDGNPDLHRSRPGRRGALRALLPDEVTCRTRFIGADFAEGLRALRGEGIHPDMIYMDLGMSSMQVDAWERGFSYSYDAPLDMRMDSRQEFSAADLVNEWPESPRSPGPAPLRRGALCRRDRPPDRQPPPAEDHLGAGRRGQGRDAGQGALRRRPPGQAHLPGDRIAVNGEIDSLDDALPTAWAMLPIGRPPRRDLLPLARGPSRQAVPRRPRAGCVCPPELPVCACGREPEADLLTRRAVAPGPEEIAANARSRSAHLRAAVKIGEAA